MHSVCRPVFKTEHIFPAMDQFSSQAKDGDTPTKESLDSYAEQILSILALSPRTSVGYVQET